MMFPLCMPVVEGGLEAVGPHHNSPVVVGSPSLAAHVIVILFVSPFFSQINCRGGGKGPTNMWNLF
jgi:hypothetical protein